MLVTTVAVCCCSFLLLLYAVAVCRLLAGVVFEVKDGFFYYWFMNGWAM